MSFNRSYLGSIPQARPCVHESCLARHYRLTLHFMVKRRASLRSDEAEADDYDPPEGMLFYPEDDNDAAKQAQDQLPRWGRGTSDGGDALLHEFEMFFTAHSGPIKMHE